MDVLFAIVTVFFVGMGLLALAVPERIAATFGTLTLTAAGRNEIRAVYGGFGVAIAALLLVAHRDPGLRPGALLAVAVALLGMAAGRLVAAAIERPARFYPSWFYCVLECAMAAVLWRAAWG